MSESHPASDALKKRPRLGGRGVALLAGAVLVLAVAGIVVVAERRAGPAQPVGGPAIGTQDESPAPRHAPASAAPPAADSAPAKPAGHAANGRPTAIPPGQAQSQAQSSPAGPASTQPASPKPSFDIVHVGPDGGAVIAGRAAPDAEVTVKDGARELGSVNADPNGEWVLLPEKPLPAGPQELTLTARSPGERNPAQGDGSVVLTVPDHARHADAAALPALAVLTPEAGGPRVLQAPNPAAGSSPAPAPSHPGGKSDRLGMDAVDYDQNGNIRFGGAARPGASVRVYVDNRPAGDAQADAQGRWTLTPGLSVSPGEHQLRVDQLDAKGKVVGRVELPFRRVELSAAEIGPGRIVVQPRQNLWRIARLTYGHGIHYTVIYRANLDQIRDPNKIYPGQVFAMPSSAGPEPGAAGPAAPTSSIRSR